MCAGIASRDGGGSVTGGWLLPWVMPGFAVPGPSGADSGLSIAFVESLCFAGSFACNFFQ